MKIILLSLISSLILTIILGIFALPILRKIKAGQPILSYVKTHKEKAGTPTMGGIFFIIPSVITALIFGRGRIATVSIAIGLAFLIVGFIDDFIKIKLKQNEGLKAYQKILFQLGISLIAGFFAFENGLTVFHIPFTKKSVDLGWISIILIAIIFIAITNCVNLTDGLDGLAGSVSAIYLVEICVLIGFQTKALSHLYLDIKEYENLQILSASLVGGILGFLIFNVNKAKVFMGDTGSLSIGGFIGAISVFSSNSFFIPILGIMFVLSGISVILQVGVYKKSKKRVFLMAPLHHHFQMKGYSETQISYCYYLITLFFGCMVIFSFL